MVIRIEDIRVNILFDSLFWTSISEYSIAPLIKSKKRIITIEINFLINLYFIVKPILFQRISEGSGAP